MKGKLHKLFSVLLSLVVLFSTFSFTVESHYCGDELIEVSVFSAVEGCGMEMISDSTENQFIIKKTCCRNEADFVEGNSADQQGLQKKILPQVYFVASLLFSYQNLFTSPTSEIAYYQYKPPLINEDITILFENFRI